MMSVSSKRAKRSKSRYKTQAHEARLLPLSFGGLRRRETQVAMIWMWLGEVTCEPQATLGCGYQNDGVGLI